MSYNTEVAWESVRGLLRFGEAPPDSDLSDFMVKPRGHSGASEDPLGTEWELLRRHVSSIASQGAHYGPGGDKECT